MRVSVALMVVPLLLAQPVIAQEQAANADGVFQIAARSVVSIQVFDRQAGSARKRVAFGSGVAIAATRVVTNCHVLAPGIDADGASRELVVEVKEARERRGRAARLVSADPGRDLCVLDVPGLEATSAQFGSTRGLRVGQRVYAVGSPQGLELTFSGGLISGLRRTSAEPLIQTDAALSPGSSGGGLFGDDARLIGITTFGVIGGQNLNFAVPVEWIKDASAHGVSVTDFSAIVAYWRKRVQGGAGAAGATASGGRWAHVVRSPQGYDVLLDLGRIERRGSQAQVWLLHNFFEAVGPERASAYRSRVLLADIDCAAGRWSVRHASTYTEPFATGRRLTADDFTPSTADYRPTTAGSAMDHVRRVACR